MVAKGKDASDLFPAVVKNVVSKNIEVSILIGHHYRLYYIDNYATNSILFVSSVQMTHV